MKRAAQPCEARRAIMAAIRRHTAEAQPLTAHRDEPFSSTSRGPLLSQRNSSPAAFADFTIDAAARISTFKRELEAAGGHCTVAHSEGEAASQISNLIRDVKGRRIALSDAPVLRSILASVKSKVEWLKERAATGELFECEVGITSAQWGIAETGTLILESERERHRLISLIPPVHIAVLEASKILATLGEALNAVQGRDADAMSRAITFITGPSRTADIELTLATGVHGPGTLHVVLMDR